MLLNATITISVDQTTTAEEILQCLAKALFTAAEKLEEESGGPQVWDAAAQERRKWAFLGRD